MTSPPWSLFVPNWYILTSHNGFRSWIRMRTFPVPPHVFAELQAQSPEFHSRVLAKTKLKMYFKFSHSRKKSVRRHHFREEASYLFIREKKLKTVFLHLWVAKKFFLFFCIRESRIRSGSRIRPERTSFGGGGDLKVWPRQLTLLQ